MPVTVQGQATETVTAPTVTVTLASGAAGIQVGQADTATAQVNGTSALPAGSTVAWSVSNGNLASVTQDTTNPLVGHVMGLGVGSVAIICSITIP